MVLLSAWWWGKTLEILIYWRSPILSCSWLTAKLTLPWDVTAAHKKSDTRALGYGSGRELGYHLQWHNHMFTVHKVARPQNSHISKDVLYQSLKYLFSNSYAKRVKSIASVGIVECHTQAYCICILNQSSKFVSELCHGRKYLTEQQKRAGALFSTVQ